MKKYFTLLLASLLLISLQGNSQLSPALVNNFAVSTNINSGYRVTWDVANNETISSFEVEKSTDGKDFTSVVVVMPTDKKGSENYKYSGATPNNDKIMYRLKIVNKAMRITYSKILFIHAKQVIERSVKIIGNPVIDKLIFSYGATSAEQVNVKVFNMSGNIILSQKINSKEGNNTISINLNSSFNPGIYMLEINNGIEKQTAKFIKQ